MPEKLKLLLVDDHDYFRQSLAAFLKELPELEVLGEARNGIEAEEMAMTLSPDLVLMDFKMPERNGLKTAKLIKNRRPSIKVILFSLFSNEVNTVQEMEAIDLFIPKQRLFEEVVEAIYGLFHRLGD